MVKNEADFQKLMREIDSEMITEGVPVAARQLDACGKVAKRLGIVLPVGGFGFASRAPREGVYSGHDLALRTKSWFFDLYGTKLKVDFDIGALAIEMFGDIFKMRIPLAYGKVAAVVNPATMGECGSGRINILDLIVDLTPTLASRLTVKMLSEIGELFVLGMDAFGHIHNRRGDELLFKAESDFKASTFHLLHRPPELGLSRWASLQAVEKVFKSLIAQRGLSYPKGHDGHNLMELSKIASGAGMEVIDIKALESVQCSPGVRYEGVGLTVVQAIEAQHAALRICRHVFEQFYSSNASSTEAVYR